MGSVGTFEQFDPLTGHVPSEPFPALPGIARRARWILRNRTKEQVISGTVLVGYVIAAYFEREKEQFISDLLEKPHWVWGMLPNSQRHETSLRDLLESWPSDSDDGYPDSFQHPRNTLEVDALREGIDAFFIDDDESFPAATKSEYFALFALENLAYALEWLRGKDHKWATNLALEAMDAVCFAEELAARETLTAQIDELKNQLAGKGDLESAVDEMARARATANAQKAALARHRENHAMKDDVWRWYEAHGHEYTSLDKAAEAVAGSVVPITFRTARRWISDFRRSGPPARRL